MNGNWDLYKGIGTSARWLGSLEGVTSERETFADVLSSQSLSEYEAKVLVLMSRNGAHPRADGWPWTWQSTFQTGAAMSFADGAVWVLDKTHWVNVDDPTDTVPARFEVMPHSGAVQQLPWTPITRLREAIRELGVSRQLETPEQFYTVLLSECFYRLECASAHLRKTSVGLRAWDGASYEPWKLVAFQHFWRSREADILHVLGVEAEPFFDYPGWIFKWVRDHAHDFTAYTHDIESDATLCAGPFACEVSPEVFERLSERGPQGPFLRQLTISGLMERRISQVLRFANEHLDELSIIRSGLLLERAIADGLVCSYFPDNIPAAWADVPCPLAGGRSLRDACAEPASYQELRQAHALELLRVKGAWPF